MDIPYDASVTDGLLNMDLHTAVGVAKDMLVMRVVGLGGNESACLEPMYTSRMLGLGHHAIIAVAVRM